MDEHTLVVLPTRDADYAEWIRQHPDGYVVHVKTRTGKDELIWHQADCSHIQPDGKQRFVERNAIKALSLNPGVLAEWLVATYPGRGLHYCKTCQSRWLKEQQA